MSTKVEDICKKCKTPVSPIDTSIRIDKYERVFRINFWRYHCMGCNWVWANDLQRQHNERKLDTTLRLIKNPYWGET